MKNVKKIALFVIFGGLFSLTGFAQSQPLAIENNTNCSYEIQYPQVKDCTTSDQIVSGAKYCIGPNSTISIHPIAASSYDWEKVIITPVTKCPGDQCGTSKAVTNLIVCSSGTSFGTTLLDDCNECNEGSSTTAEFDAPTTISITN